MTDRHSAYIVVLNSDIREDDAEHIINALRMVKGVASVEPVIADYNQHIARVRVDREWRDRLLKLLKDTDEYA